MDPSSAPANSSGEPAPTSDEADAPWSRRFLMATLLLVPLVLWPAVSELLAPKSIAVPHAIHGVDPNTAPWWELASLPALGPSTAQAIVEYREKVRRERGDPDLRVFTSAVDLDQVLGIGPKKIQQFAADLRFDPPPPFPEATSTKHP